MMFTRAASVFVLALPLLATATAVPRTDPPPVNQCNTGSLQCCSSAQSASAPGVSLLLGLLGIVVGNITGLVGLTCSPILNLVSPTCSQQAVCCTGNSFSGLIVLGCNAINL